MIWSECKARFWEIYGGDADLYPEVADQLLPLANMAIKRFVGESHCFVARSKLPLTSGTQEYDLPSDCDQVIRAAYDNDKLSATSKWDLQEAGPDGWDRFEGTPRWYYVAGLNEKIGLYRIPSMDTVYEETSSGETIGTGYGIIVADGGYGARIANTGYGVVLIDSEGTAYDIVSGALDLFYYAIPEDIENDEDEIPLPAWFQPYVIYDMLRSVYASAIPGADVARAAFWGRRVQAGARRLDVRAATPSPKRHVMRVDDYNMPTSAWPASYPDHIEEN